MPSASPIPSNPQHGAISTVQSLGNYTATAYCNKFGAGSINGGGVTAGGTDLRDGKQHYVIAAGPGSGLKIGDQVTISPSPFGDGTVFKVDDHGGAIVGHHIDIYVADCAKANAWGHRSVSVQKTSGGRNEGPPSGTLPSLGDPLGIGGFLGKLGILFQGNFWLRVLMTIGGFALIVFAATGAARAYGIKTIGKALK